MAEPATTTDSTSTNIITSTSFGSTLRRRLLYFCYHILHNCILCLHLVFCLLSVTRFTLRALTESATAPVEIKMFVLDVHLACQ